MFLHLVSTILVVCWKDKFVVNAEGNPTTTTQQVFKTYKNVSQEIKDQLNAEAKAVQIILTGIDNDIYSTVDACPNACEMWKAIERLKQGESINVQDLETNLFWEFEKFTSLDGESLESYYSRNTGYEGKRSGTVAGARETIGSSMVQKSGIQCYNCKEYGHVARECQKPKRAKDAAYRREKMLLCKQEEAGIQLNAEQANWKDDTDDESDDQELEAHYMYMAKLQQVSPDVVDSGPIFDKEPEQKVQNDDHYDVFAIDCQHPEQSKSVYNTYLIEQDAQNVRIESEDMNYDSEQIDQNDEDVDLAKEHPISIHNFIKMSNTNNTMQIKTSNTFHNAIMEAVGKDRPPMLAPDKVVSVSECSSETTTERHMENYKNVSQDIRDQLNAEAEVVQIILTGIDNYIYSTVDAFPNACEMWKAIERLKQDIRDQLNAEAEAVQIILTGIDSDIYSTVDACPNASEMWKAIKRLKQGESINVQDLETNLYWEFRKFTSRDGESLELYYSRFYKMMNELVRNQCDVTNHQVNVQFLLQLQPEWQRSQQAATRNRGKEIVNSPPPIYDQEPSMVNEDDEMSKDKETDKLMALISLSFKKIYKPTNNNLQTSSNTSRANQDNSPKINRGTGFDNQRIGNVAGARETVGTTVVQKSRIQCYNCKEFGHVARECQKLKRAKDAAYHKKKMLLCKQKEAGNQWNAEQADWRDDTYDESEDQELEAHYMYMAQIQEVTLDTGDDSGPIFDFEPLQKVSNNDNYNVFAIENEHPKQSKSIHDTYLIEQDEHNMIIDSLDMSYDREQLDQDDDDDLANERELLASLIEKLKCEIDDSKNRNIFLETSNKVLVDKLKGEIKDFKTKNKSLKSSNNRFKEANNKMSAKNELMYNDLKKFQAELDRRNDVKYASKVEIDSAKAKGDLIINVDLEKFHVCLKEEMVADLRYFNSLELEVDSLKSQLETQKTRFLNEIDRLLREYYYVDHMNVILGVYTELDEDKGIAISELKKLIEKLKGKYVDTKFEKSSVIRQPNSFKSLRPSILGKPTIFSYSLERKDFSKSKSVTKNNVSNDFSKPVTAQILPPNKKSILKNTNVLALGMYKLHTTPTQTRTTQLPHDFRKTNKRVSFSTRVIPATSFSRPQLKSNQIEDRFMLNNSQGKK
nr:hypothetical protein [Tanacetum cinerariifolium]